jgi:hypothetical protein
MRYLAYNVRYPVVPINSLLLATTLYSSFITTLVVIIFVVTFRHELSPDRTVIGLV